MAIQFIMIKSGVAYDISDVVERCTWSGRKNSPARSLTLQILDDPDLGENNRTHLDVMEGNHIIFLENGSELFRGIIMKQSFTQDYKMTLTAYDNAIYLSNNNDSFNFKAMTASQIFMDCCNRFGIARGKVTDTMYQIPKLVDANSSIYDILCNALSKTYMATGERFYIISIGGQLHLQRRKEQITKLIIETGDETGEYGNITSYSYSKDISNVRTRIKLVTNKGAVQSQWKNFELEEKIGIMQNVQTPDDSMKGKNLAAIAITLLTELAKPNESLDITALGDSSVYSGTAIYVRIPEIGIDRVFYVDSDTHTWDGSYHTMRLTLNFASNIEPISDEGEYEIKISEEKDAEQLAKEAAKRVKEKAAIEKKIITAGSKAEKAANAAETALANAKKQKVKSQAVTFAKACQNNAVTAVSELASARMYMTEIKPLVVASQQVVSTQAQNAIFKAEQAARRANEASVEAANYL